MHRKQTEGRQKRRPDEVLQTSTTDTSEAMLVQDQSEHTRIFNTPEGSHDTPPHNSMGSSNTADRTPNESSGQYFFEFTGQYIEDETNRPDEETFSKLRGKAKTANTGKQNVEPASRKRKWAQRTRATTPNNLELFALFTSYLDLHNDDHFDELIALEQLANELILLEQHTRNFTTLKGIEFATAFFVVSFPAWLRYRKQIVKVKRKLASMQPQEQAAHHHIAVIERSRLATELRQAHEAFVGAGYAGLRPEQVIYRAFVTLQNVPLHSESAKAICIGFKGMEDELGRLGDRLMKDGGKWILGSHGSVAGLKGMDCTRG
jgi:hypothetical protein